MSVLADVKQFSLPEQGHSTPEHYGGFESHTSRDLETDSRSATPYLDPETINTATLDAQNTALSKETTSYNPEAYIAFIEQAGAGISRVRSMNVAMQDEAFVESLRNKERN